MSDEDIRRKTDLAQTTIQNTYLWDNVAKKNLNFAKSLLKNSSSSTISKIGWVSTWATKCGIASYSKNLIQNMTHIEKIFAPLVIGEGDSLNVNRCWSLDNNVDQNLNQLYEEIVSSRCTSLIIQFNFGFFDCKELENLISKLSKINVKIFMFLHSTVGPNDIVNKSLNDYKDALIKSSKIFVHSVNDLNHLKSIGVVNNVSIFPHGIYDSDFLNLDTYLDGKSVFKDEWKISSYGYCLPHKGFLELIQAIYLLREKGINAKLNLYTSIYNKDYEYFAKKLEEEILSLNISDFVFMDTSYSTYDESLNNLSKSDLLVFPYQSSNESSSAAVRHGISSGRPTMVTPLNIFDDIQRSVDLLPGFDKYSICNGILNHIKHRENNINDYNYVQQKRLNYVKDNSFKKLSLMLNNIINAYENDIYS